MTATTVNQEIAQKIESAPFKLQKGVALLGPKKEWGEDPAHEVISEIGAVPVAVAAVEANISPENRTLRQIEQERVRWAIAQSQALLNLYSKVDGSESDFDFDKEWKATLKEETDGEMTTGQAEKLIAIAQSLKTAKVESPETRFSLAGLTEWAKVAGTKGPELRDRILELAAQDDAEFGEQLLTSKRVKAYHGVAMAEISQAVPDALRKQVNELSGSAKLKARKELVSYVKASDKVGSEEIVQSLRESTSRKMGSNPDVQSLLKEAAQDAKAVASIVGAIEDVEIENVEKVCNEALTKNLATETAKLVKVSQKRNKAIVSLPGIVKDSSKLFDRLWTDTQASDPALRSLIANVGEGLKEISEDCYQLFLPLGDDGAGYQLTTKVIKGVA
jgi:hypothetical protein